jgi:hypothetical protein
MSVIYSMDDTRDVKVDDVVFTLRPLDYLKKSQMETAISQGNFMDAAVVALKSGIKDVKGLKRPDGTEYKLEFDESDMLTDRSINDLLNIPQNSKLSVIAFSMLNGISQSEFVDPQTGEPLEGVKFVEKPKAKKPRARRS